MLERSSELCVFFFIVLQDLDSYLKARAPVTFLSELRSNLQVSNEPGMRYNIPLMNALVLYVGTQAITFIRNKGLTPNMSTIAHSSHMDIFQNLAVDLDTEGNSQWSLCETDGLGTPSGFAQSSHCLTSVEACNMRLTFGRILACDPVYRGSYLPALQKYSLPSSSDRDVA
jgi:hypothetical protein